MQQPSSVVDDNPDIIKKKQVFSLKFWREIARMHALPLSGAVLAELEERFPRSRFRGWG